MSKRLDIRIHYNMVVTSVMYKKRLEERGLPIHIFDIFFESEHGEMYRGEYLTSKDTQDVFEPGIKIRFKVSKVMDYGDEIVPLPESTQNEERKLSPDYLKPVAGESYSIAAGCAKDIVANMQGDANDILEAFTTLAEGIDAWLIKKQKERIIG